MTTRFSRTVTVLSKLETTPGTPVSVSASTDGVLLGAMPEPKLDFRSVERGLIRGYFANDESLPSDLVVGDFTISTELAGSGTAGTAPAYDDLLQISGFGAPTVVTDTLVRYTVATEGTKAATMDLNRAGVHYLFTHCRANLTIGLEVGKKPTLEVAVKGLLSTMATQTVPTVTLSGYKKPKLVNATATGSLTLGGTIDLDTGLVTGGTGYCSQGFSIDLSNTVELIEMLPCTAIEITDRKISTSITIPVTDAQEVAFHAAVVAMTEQSMYLLHGTEDGYKVAVWCPAVQLTNPEPVDVQGIACMRYTVRVMPSAGNDDMTLFVM